MDISHEDLVFLINVAYPDAIHGKDFWVVHPVEENSRTRTGTAFIAKWAVTDRPQPTDDELEGLYEAHLPELIKDRVARAAQIARDTRDALLKETDWVVTRATETGEDIPADMMAYRQTLRDLPEQDGFPEEIDWPKAP